MSRLHYLQRRSDDTGRLRLTDSLRKVEDDKREARGRRL